MAERGRTVKGGGLFLILSCFLEISSCHHPLKQPEHIPSTGALPQAPLAR